MTHNQPIDHRRTAQAFKAGLTYEARSLCDYDCVFSFEVIARTPRFVTLRDGGGEDRRVGIKVDTEGVEWCNPLGSYSMAPSIRADRERCQ